VATDDADAVCSALQGAAAVLGLPLHAGPTAEALATWVHAWGALYNPPGEPTPNDTPLSADAAPESAATTTPPASPAPAGWPAGVTHPKTIKSFVRRAGRTTTGQAKALSELGPQFIRPYQPELFDYTDAFGRNAPTVLEIGFGMGETTAHIAALMPQTNFLCCEVHEPGVGALVKRIGEQNLANIRIISHDAVEVIDRMLPLASLAGVHVFFPDPWHKTKHNKRRLIQPPLVARLAARLQPGGYLHCATDWQPYAEQMLEVLSAEPLLANTAEGYATKPSYRPLTKFENRGLKLGHGVWDLVFRRV